MPTSQDLLAPFDPTAYAQLAGDQILQLITGAAPNTEIGFCVITDDAAGIPDVPDASITTKWQRYMWIRRTATSVGAYLWNPVASSDPTYLKWVSINISALGTGVIQGYMIADNTIPDEKIISLDYSKLTGVPLTFTPGGAAGGDLSGTYPDPVVAPLAITGAKIATDTITVTNLADEAVENDKLKPNAVGLAIKRTNAGATACEDAVVKVTELANPTVAEANKLIKVNAAGTGFEYGGQVSVGIEVWTSSEITLAANASEAHNHSGTRPSMIKAKLRCVTTDGGYAVGDEIDLSSVMCDPDGTESDPPAMSAGANATNVFFSFQNSSPAFVSKAGVAKTAFTPANWKLVIIAIWFT